ncbi:MAG: phosphoribulokinase, partial [Okeania sp. SIO2D1]|nr:phosphoribulokinase [Okeania sp. SIO2D1]
RGYSEEQVLKEMEKREPDSEEFIRPQRKWADVVVTFYPPSNDENSSQLHVRLVLRPTIPHPDFLEIIGQGSPSFQPAVRLGLDRDMGKPVDVLEIDSHATKEQVNELEMILCEDTPYLKDFCSPKGDPDLGKLVGTTGELLQSYPLALTQLLVAYHMIKATNIFQ